MSAADDPHTPSSSTLPVRAAQLAFLRCFLARLHRLSTTSSPHHQQHLQSIQRPIDAPSNTRLRHSSLTRNTPNPRILPCLPRLQRCERVLHNDTTLFPSNTSERPNRLRSINGTTVRRSTSTFKLWRSCARISRASGCRLGDHNKRWYSIMQTSRTWTDAKIEQVLFKRKPFSLIQPPPNISDNAEV